MPTAESRPADSEGIDETYDKKAQSTTVSLSPATVARLNERLGAGETLDDLILSLLDNSEQGNPKARYLGVETSIELRQREYSQKMRRFARDKILEVVRETEGRISFGAALRATCSKYNNLALYLGPDLEIATNMKVRKIRNLFGDLQATSPEYNVSYDSGLSFQYVSPRMAKLSRLPYMIADGGFYKAGSYEVTARVGDKNIPLDSDEFRALMAEKCKEVGVTAEPSEVEQAIKGAIGTVNAAFYDKALGEGEKFDGTAGYAERRWL